MKPSTRRAATVNCVACCGSLSAQPWQVRVLIPSLKPFFDRHPALQVELILEDQRQDLVREGVDVAIRFGQLTDSTAIARKLKSWPRILAASPSYLKTAPPLIKPADLAAHSVIVGPQGARDWSFSKDGTATSVRIEGRLKIPALEGALTAAAAGMGIVLSVTGALRGELTNGTLVRVLEDWDLGSVDVHAVFTSGRAAKPSARALIAHLSEALAEF